MTVVQRDKVGPETFNANQCKNALLAYFRFKRGYPYVATEYLECDVVAAKSSEWIEVEVKISWSDYCAEWKKKKHKDGLSIYIKNKYSPNRKYFAAPPSLAQRIANDCAENHPEYGVLSIWTEEDITFVRRATTLHKEQPTCNTLDGIISRVTSELITLRRKLRAA